MSGRLWATRPSHMHCGVPGIGLVGAHRRPRAATRCGEQNVRTVNSSRHSVATAERSMIEEIRVLLSAAMCSVAGGSAVLSRDAGSDEVR
jgi:hypothetical protein